MCVALRQHDCYLYSQVNVNDGWMHMVRQVVGRAYTWQSPVPHAYSQRYTYVHNMMYTHHGVYRKHIIMHITNHAGSKFSKEYSV